jgi:hypothetical protein
MLAPPSPALLAKAERIRAQLTALYPPPFAPLLNHRNHYEFLCSVLLSAQTTDKAVNACSPARALPCALTTMLLSLPCALAALSRPPLSVCGCSHACADGCAAC